MSGELRASLQEFILCPTSTDAALASCAKSTNYTRKTRAPSGISRDLGAGAFLHYRAEFINEWNSVAAARILAMAKRLSAQTRARKIKLLLFDVDGVLTDGKLFFPPFAPGQPTTAIEVKGFHAHDGTSISLARMADIKTGLITKRNSETVALHARDLKLEFVRQGIHDKRTAFEQIVKEAGLALEQAAFVGDDIIDLPAMRVAGLAIAVQNARIEVKKEAHYTTPHAGGDGALRDAVEFILKAQGKWKSILEGYIGECGPTVQ